MDVNLTALKPHPQNYNQHSPAQIERLAQSLERFGQGRSIVTWRGLVVAGNGLVEAARRLGWKTLRADDRSEDWTEDEARAYMAADNELARLADPDEAALAALAASLHDVDAELAALAAGSEERLEARAGGDASAALSMTGKAPGFTAPANAPGQDASKLSKAALGVWLGEQQRLGHEPPAWLEFYDDLLEERDGEGRLRWDWRKALFIAWSCVPRGQREPKTVADLAAMLGVRPSTVRKWRQHDPEIVERISQGPRRLLLEHVADVYAALVAVATQADPRAFQDRRLFLEMAGEYRPSAAIQARLEGQDGGPIQVEDVTVLSDAERAERITTILDRARARRA